MEKETRHPEYQYLDILQDIMDNGFEKQTLQQEQN